MTCPFSNTYINAMKLLAMRLGLTVDASMADESAVINYYANSQTKIIDLMKKFSEWTCHIFVIEGTEVKLYCVEKKLSEGPVALYNNVNIYGDPTIENNELEKTIEAKWVTLTVNSDDKLADTDMVASVNTGLESGGTLELEPYDNNKNTILAALEKRKRIHLLPRVNIEVDMSEGIRKVGDVVYFKLSWAAGKIVIDELDVNLEEEKMKIGGISNVSFT